MLREDIEKADAAKLHSEVNQYINHNLTLTTFAITTFGVAAGVVMTKTDLIFGTEPNPHSFSLLVLAVCCILSIVLSIIWAGVRITHNAIAFIAAYLRENGLSCWEWDLQKLSGGKVIFRTSHQTIFRRDIFFVLLSGTWGAPFLVNYLCSGKLDQVYLQSYGGLIGLCMLSIWIIPNHSRKSKIAIAWRKALSALRDQKQEYFDTEVAVVKVFAADGNEVCELPYDPKDDYHIYSASILLSDFDFQKHQGRKYSFGTTVNGRIRTEAFDGMRLAWSRSTSLFISIQSCFQ